jgi:ketosteroid isomerase-like protein
VVRVVRPSVCAELLVVLLTGCARAPDVTAARTALMEADRAFNRATAARRTDGWMEFIAEDGAMIRAPGTITGRAAIREAMAKTFADTAFSLRWEPLQSDVGAASDLGYTNGRYKVQFRDAKGKAVERTGRYLTVWKKQADGSWKVVRDIGVQDPPPTGP